MRQKRGPKDGPEEKFQWVRAKNVDLEIFPDRARKRVFKFGKKEVLKFGSIMKKGS